LESATFYGIFRLSVARRDLEARRFGHPPKEGRGMGRSLRRADGNAPRGLGGGGRPPDPSRDPGRVGGSNGSGLTSGTLHGRRPRPGAAAGVRQVRLRSPRRAEGGDPGASRVSLGDPGKGEGCRGHDKVTGGGSVAPDSGSRPLLPVASLAAPI